MVQRTHSADIHISTTLSTVDSVGPSKKKFLSKASIWVDHDKRIEDVDTSKPLKADLRSFGDSPTAGGFVLCHGRFWCKKEGEDVVVHIKAFDNYPLPGVGDIDSCPRLQTASVTVIGLAGAAQEPTNQPNSLRSFELKSTVYGPGRSAQFEVQCFFPPNNRFKNTPTPKQNELCSVTGAIIGTYTKSQNLAVLIDDIAYLSPGNGDTAAGPVSPPVTPSRKRGTEWAGRTQRDI